MSAQGPLVLVVGLKGLGLRVWGQGLTIIFIRGFHPYILYKGDNVLCKSPHYFENEVSDEDDLNPDFKIHKKNYIRFFHFYHHKYYVKSHVSINILDES